MKWKIKVMKWIMIGTHTFKTKKQALEFRSQWMWDMAFTYYQKDVENAISLPYRY